MTAPDSTATFIDSLRPAGSKRSGKRDLIVNVFLRQQGHLTADDLVDLIRKEDERISRATISRTLQWMVDAGIARKVDFGEGRFRFEHSYRHPRHFHLICKACNRSFEFLSSDIEALLEEVAAARGFAARQSVLQIHGTCDACQTGKPPMVDGGVTVVKGCVGQAASPGIVLDGTARSSTAKRGSPVSRCSTNNCPVLVAWMTAGRSVPSRRTAARAGGDALS
jgi:Fur family ferric uptake transcriptional regulator